MRNATIKVVNWSACFVATTVLVFASGAVFGSLIAESESNPRVWVTDEERLAPIVQSPPRTNRPPEPLPIPSDSWGDVPTYGNWKEATVCLNEICTE